MSGLRYENLDICHSKDLLNIWADADVIKYTNMKLPCTLEDAEHRIGILKNSDVFAVIQKGQLIGIVGCPAIDREKMQFGLFYQFCKSSWGQGNATAAANRLLEYMKNKYKNATLFADVAVDNFASEKILQKLGFELFSSELTERGDITRKVNNYRLSIKSAQ